MTHSEAVATNTALEPTACVGELVDPVSIADYHYNYTSGRFDERTVDVRRCSTCGWHVSLTGEVALNHYHVPEPRAILAALVGHVARSDRTQTAG